MADDDMDNVNTSAHYTQRCPNISVVVYVHIARCVITESNLTRNCICITYPQACTYSKLTICIDINRMTLSYGNYKQTTQLLAQGIKLTDAYIHYVINDTVQWVLLMRFLI